MSWLNRPCKCYRVGGQGLGMLHAEALTSTRIAAAVVVAIALCLDVVSRQLLGVVRCHGRSMVRLSRSMMLRMSNLGLSSMHRHRRHCTGDAVQHQRKRKEPREQSTQHGMTLTPRLRLCVKGQDSPSVLPDSTVAGHETAHSGHCGVVSTECKAQIGTPLNCKRCY